MAAPTWQATGTLAAGTGNVTVVWPSHATDDIGLLVVESANQAIALTTPAGFVEIPDSPQGTGTAGGTTSTRLAVFWCRATSGSMASPVVTDPGDHACAYIVTFRGCITSGDPWDVTAGDALASASTTFTIPGDTTTLAECLVVAIVATGADVSTGRATGWTNASLASITERGDLYSSTASNGGGISVAEGVKTTAGAYNATTGTLSTSFVQGRVSIALKPPSSNVIVTPGLGAPVFTGFAAAALLTIRALAGLGAPVFTGFAPTVAISDHKVVTPGLGATVFTGQSPAVAIGAATIVQPGTGAPVFTGLAPTILVTVKIPVGLGQPVFTGQAPVVAISNNQRLFPGVGAPVFSGFAPNVVAAVTAKPGLGQPVFTGLAASVVLSDNRIITVGLGQTTFTGFAPAVSTATSIIGTGRGQIIFTGFAPTAIGSLWRAEALHVVTVAIRTTHHSITAVRTFAGTSITRDFTIDNDGGTIDDAMGDISENPGML